jgi:hypothetical protein
VSQWNQKSESHADAFWKAWDTSLRKGKQKPFKDYILGDQIRVSGIIVGEIDQSTRIMELSDFDAEKNFGGHLIDLCWEFARRKPHPYKPIEVIQVFASTLACHSKIRGNQPLDGRERVVEQSAGCCMRVNDGFYQANLVPKDGEGF